MIQTVIDALHSAITWHMQQIERQRVAAEMNIKNDDYTFAITALERARVHQSTVNELKAVIKEVEEIA